MVLRKKEDLRNGTEVKLGLQREKGHLRACVLITTLAVIYKRQAALSLSLSVSFFGFSFVPFQDPPTESTTESDMIIAISINSSASCPSIHA